MKKIKLVFECIDEVAGELVFIPTQSEINLKDVQSVVESLDYLKCACILSSKFTRGKVIEKYKLGDNGLIKIKVYLFCLDSGLGSAPIEVMASQQKIAYSYNDISKEIYDKVEFDFLKLLNETK